MKLEDPSPHLVLSVCPSSALVGRSFGIIPWSRRLIGGYHVVCYWVPPISIEQTL